MIKENAYIRNGSISPENIFFYKEFGYLIAFSLLSISEIDELKKKPSEWDVNVYMMELLRKRYS